MDKADSAADTQDSADTVMFRIKDTNEKIVKRKARWSDLPDMQVLSETFDFHAGLHNVRLYFETSPDTWNVAINEKNEIIAYDTHNKIPFGDIQQAYQLVVREDYQGKGLTGLFKTMHYSQHPAVGNSTGPSLLRYRFENFQDKLIGYEGPITEDILNGIRQQKCSDNSDVELNTITHTNIPDVVKYDLSVLGFDRSAFLTEWILPEKYPCRSMGIFAKDINGITIGFGAIREYEGYFTLAPVYADSDSVARNLLYSLASNTPAGSVLYIHFPAKNRLVFEIISQLNFVHSESEIRCHSNGVPTSTPWNMSRVYALQDYYPV